MTIAGSYIIQVKLQVDKDSERKFALDRLKMAKEMIGKEYDYREKLFMTMNSRMIKNYAKNYQSFLDKTRTTQVRSPSGKKATGKMVPLYLPNGTKMIKALEGVERRVMSAAEVSRIANDDSHVKNAPTPADTVVNNQATKQPKQQSQRGGRRKLSVLGKLGKASMLIYLTKVVLNMLKAGLFIDPTDAKDLVSTAFSRVNIADIGASIGMGPAEILGFDNAYGEQIGLGKGTVAKTLQNMYLRGFSNPKATLEKISKQVQGRSFRFTSAIANAYGIDPQALLTISQADKRTNLSKNYMEVLNRDGFTEKDLKRLTEARQGQGFAELNQDYDVSRVLTNKVRDQMLTLYTDEYINKLKDIQRLDVVVQSFHLLTKIEGYLRAMNLVAANITNKSVDATVETVKRGLAYASEHPTAHYPIGETGIDLFNSYHFNIGPKK